MTRSSAYAIPKPLPFVGDLLGSLINVNGMDYLKISSVQQANKQFSKVFKIHIFKLANFSNYLISVHLWNIFLCFPFEVSPNIKERIRRFIIILHLLTWYIVYCNNLSLRFWQSFLISFKMWTTNSLAIQMWIFFWIFAKT